MLPRLLDAVILALTLGGCGDQVPKGPPGTQPPGTGTGPQQPWPAANNDLSLQIQPGQGYAAKNGSFLVALQWLKGPSTTAANSVQLTFADKNRRALSSFVMQTLIPWNASAGQTGGTQQLALAPSVRTPTVITASNFTFIAPGQWTLQLQANANGTSDLAEIPLGYVP